MEFGIVAEGAIINAPLEYTTDKGKYIKDFPKYLELMYKNSFYDRMYGYKPMEELTTVTNVDRIKKLEDELFFTQEALNDLIMNSANM